MVYKLLLVFLLMLTMMSVLGRVTEPEYCPDKKLFKPCTCDYEGINCNMAKNGKDLKQALSVSPPGDNQFRVFWMVGSDITEIPERTFEKYAFKQMIMENNQITSIGKEAFIGGSILLNIISLNNNQLTEIPIPAIKGLKYLSQLRLMNNRITSVPDNAFDDFTVLASIVLANNRITKIGQKAFQNLHNLVELNLANNRITSLGDYTFFSPHPAAFRLANLAGNQISSVSPKAFEGCKAIGEVFLIYNKLETLDQAGFTPLFQIMTGDIRARLHLSGNPVKCDKRLEWILKYDSRVKQRVVGFKCNGKLPAEMTPDDLNQRI